MDGAAVEDDDESASTISVAAAQHVKHWIETIDDLDRLDGEIEQEERETAHFQRRIDRLSNRVDNVSHT